MTIKVGDSLPDTQFIFMSDDGPAQISTAELFSGKKVVLFAVPGAFTPTCHANHLPGFLEHYDTLKEKGVDEIAMVTVNDVHVVDAWARASKVGNKIHFLADGSAEFSKAIGMDIDLGPLGMGVRSKRYSMIVEDGKVTAINLEENPGQAVASSAATILSQL
ncbi:MAG: peroxiredoxin [Rhizobiaceae bacterium]